MLEKVLEFERALVSSIRAVLDPGPTLGIIAWLSLALLGGREWAWLTCLAMPILRDRLFGPDAWTWDYGSYLRIGLWCLWIASFWFGYGQGMVGLWLFTAYLNVGEIRDRRQDP